MGNLHVVLGAVSDRLHKSLTAADFTAELAAKVAIDLARPGAVKPGRAVPTIDEIMAIFADAKTRYQISADCQRQREGIESERRADFERRPLGRGPLARLLDVAEGPVTPIRDASVFFDPYRDHRSLPTPGLEGSEIVPLSSGLWPFVRGVEEPLSDSKYLEILVRNAATSVTSVFGPAVADGSLFRNFAGVIKAQHAVLVEGPGGRYRGGTCAKSDISPGVFRHERALALGADPTKPSGALKTGFFPIELRPKLGPIRIEGFEKDELPFVDHQNIVLLPLGVLDRVVARMSELLGLAFANLDQPAGLRHLSDYFHLATQSHVFERGNNSLFMTHVNFALERMGLLPISHGQLDWIAYGVSYDEVRPHFYGAIAARNPDVRLPDR